MKEINIARTLIDKRKGHYSRVVAKYIGISKASISKWEIGQSYLDIIFLPQLATYSNISTDDFIEFKMIKLDFT